MDDEGGRILDEAAEPPDQTRRGDDVHEAVVVLQRVEDEALGSLRRLPDSNKSRLWPFNGLRCRGHFDLVAV